MTCRRMLALCAPLLMTGCMPKMTMEDMKAMQPQRPAELDALNAFVGDWESEGEMKFSFLEEPIKSTGTNSAHWEGDNWYLVSDDVFGMGEMGTMHAHSTWTYDAKTKRYRSTWVDSMGSTGIGQGWYNDEDRSWRMKATSFGPHGKSTMGGTVTFVDDDTMTWTWTEYMFGGLMKTVEMSGTSRRKK